ncbi:hypothetical protein ACFIJ5_16330 [Haloimpatiens sp. FM7330]|uniref:hypothetical protein n=1 Tax=Haloimpatiens sp. FM7330 TaxID=3298610 RepID=UPI0036437012
MHSKINQMINDGYKILKFQRDVDLKTNEEFGLIEMKALDGYRKTINVSSDQADEIEKILFKFLKDSN